MIETQTSHTLPYLLCTCININGMIIQFYYYASIIYSMLTGARVCALENSSLWRFQDFSQYVAFAENASFRSSGVIF